MIWSVDGFEKDQAENLVRTMASRFRADQAVWDVARVLRMPGFRNHKYKELRHFVKDVHQTPPIEKAYRPADFSAVSELERKRQPAFGALKPQSTEGGLSQSERDWAYVMRELEHGVDPDSLRSQLEQSRQDKPNPQYYAQRTVARALMACARSRSWPVPTESLREV